MARRHTKGSILTLHRKIALGNKQSNVPGYVKPNIIKSMRKKGK